MKAKRASVVIELAIPERWEQLAEAIALILTKPGAPCTRADAYKAALRIGLCSLAGVDR